MLSADERRRVFNELIVEVDLADARAVAEPRVLCVGGQPGAGKSGLQQRLRHQLSQEAAGPRGVVEVNNDRYRYLHPDYKRWVREDDQQASVLSNQDANAWVDMAIEYLMPRRVHVLLESSLRQPATMGETLASFRAAGYHAELHVVATCGATSRLAIAERYLTQVEEDGSGRYVIAKTHADSYERLPVSVEFLADGGCVDEIHIWRRDGMKVAGGPIPGTDYAAVLREELAAQVAQLDAVEISQRIEACLAVAEKHDRSTCARDLRVLADEVC